MQLSRYLDIVSVGFSTAQAAVEFDTASVGGCEGVMFLGVIASTAARTPSLALKLGASTTSFVNCASTFTHASTAAGVTVIATDVFRPGKRWVGATLTTTTATPSYCIAMAYGLRKSVGNFTASGTNMPTVTGGILRAVSPSSAT
jgi:hypothetical protein